MKYDIREINRVDLFEYIEKNYPELAVADEMERGGTKKKVYENRKTSEMYSVYRNATGVYYYFNNRVTGGKSGSIIDFVIHKNGGMAKCSMSRALEIIGGAGVELKESGTQRFNDTTQTPLDEYYKIDLRDFILANDSGYTEDLKEGTKKWPILRKYDSSGKCISKIVINTQNNGFYVGRDKKNGDEKVTIISFVQDMHGGRHNFNLGRVRGFIEAWLGNQGEKKYKRETAPRAEIKKDFRLEEHISQIINIQYFKMRGISTNLLSDPTLKPIIGTKERIVASNKVDNGGARILNTAYVLRDIDRKPVGVILKNKNIDNQTFSGAIGERGKGLIYNDYLPGQPSKMFITESFDDALSYYQLKANSFKDTQKILVATAGEISRNQLQLLDRMIGELPDLKIVVGFDNDIAGKRFYSQLIGALNPPNLNPAKSESYGYSLSQTGEGKFIKVKFENLILSPDKAEAELEKFRMNFPVNFKIERVQEEFKGKFHVTQTLIFEQTESNLEVFASRAIALRYGGALSNLLERDVPISKDFNRDLQDLLGISAYNELTEKFWNSPLDLKGEPKEAWMKIDRVALTINPGLADTVREALVSGKILKAVQDGRITGQNAIQIIKKATGDKIPFNIVAIRDEQLKKNGYNLRKTVKNNIISARDRQKVQETEKSVLKNKGKSTGT